MTRKELTPEQRIKRLKFRHGVCSAVGCPKCGASAGSRCTRNRGGKRFSPHIERVTASKAHHA